MTNYIAPEQGSEGKEERHNMSKPRLEIPSARTKIECRSSRFEHFAPHGERKLESAQTNLASARIATP